MAQERATVTMADQYSKSYIIYRSAAFSMTLKLNDP